MCLSNLVSMNIKKTSNISVESSYTQRKQYRKELLTHVDSDSTQYEQNIIHLIIHKYNTHNHQGNVKYINKKELYQ